MFSTHRIRWMERSDCSGRLKPTLAIGIGPLPPKTLRRDEQRFLHVLHDFGQDQITVIASTVRGAFREVKEKLVPVNHSLGLSKYSPTTHLQIKIKDAKGAQVADFFG